ncbi:MAG: hypothetical protein ACM3NS_05180, partial [Deltaproteobacteria bacterium]
MSPVNRNRLRFTGFVGAAFAAGLLLAGLLDLPRFGHAQQVAQLGQAAAVTAPPPAGASAGSRQLYDLSEAFASVAEHVKPSVVYIRAERKPEPVNANGGLPQMQLPPGFQRFFQFGPGFPNPQQPRVEQASG